MIAAGVMVVWAGYALGGWGYALVRGWDIPFIEWISPVRPYTWPKPPADPPPIPDDQLTPSPATAPGGGLVTSGPVVNPRPRRGRPGRTTRPGGPKTGP